MPIRCRTIAIVFALSGWAALAAQAWADPPLLPAAAPVLEERTPRSIDKETLLALLHNDDADEVRRAAEQVALSPPQKREDLLATAEAVKAALGTTRDAVAEQALRLALGTLAAAGVEDAAEWGFESMSVTHSKKTPPEVFASHVRALEMVPGAAKELMIGNIDVALNFPDADPKERERLKEFVTRTAEAMRTRELARFLDELLTGEDNLFVKMEAPLEARLIRCYQNVKADPPIKADAVVAWLDKHPGGPADVEVAALETISLLGATKADAAPKLAERLLAQPDSAVAIAQGLIAGRINRSLLPQVKQALQRHAVTREKRIVALNAELEKLMP
jgi:hypothetical protein